MICDFASLSKEISIETFVSWQTRGSGNKMKKNFLMILLLTICMSNFLEVSSMIRRIVTFPVANLRTEPIDFVATKTPLNTPLLSKDMGCQETQLLFGEVVVVNEAKSNDEWLYVEAIDQRIYKDRKWQNYSGYIKKTDTTPAIILERESFSPNLVVTTFNAMLYEDHNLTTSKFPLSFGTYLVGCSLKDGDSLRSDVYTILAPTGILYFIDKKNCAIVEEVQEFSEKIIRQNVIADARHCLGMPYVWGGRSMMTPWNGRGIVVGVDCSSLVNLVFRVCGINLPRNASCQCVDAYPVEKGCDLKPGDLIFSSSITNPQKILHVTLYAGDGKILHSTGRAGIDCPDKSRLALCEDPAELLVGRKLETFVSGDVITEGEWVGRTIVFGSVFKAIE